MAAASHDQQSQDRRARRVRLYRRRARAAAAPPSGGRDRAAHRRPPRRAGDARRCFRSSRRIALPTLVAIEGIDWRRRRPRPRLLRAAACHHPEGDQASSSPRRRRPRWSISRPTSGSPTRPPMRAGTATSTTRRSCSGRRSTAWSRSIATRSRRRGSSPIPAATPPARSFRSFRCSRPGDRSRRDRDRRQVRHDRRGRAAKEEMLFSEVSEGFHAYGVGHHRHMAELDQEFSLGRGPRGDRRASRRTSCR